MLVFIELKYEKQWQLLESCVSSCSQHHDSDLSSWWGSECKRVEWITIYREKIVHPLSVACVWNTTCPCCRALCDPPEQSGAPAAPQLQQFLTAEEAATWACTLGHGQNTGLIRTRGTSHTTGTRCVWKQRCGAQQVGVSPPLPLRLLQAWPEFLLV